MESFTTRRHTLRQIGLSLGCFAGIRPLKAAPAVRVRDLRVISMRPGLYHGWPTLARRADGELLLVCSGGREAHVCPFGWVELQRSKDGGASWTYPRVLLDSPIDDRDAGICETARGSLLVTTFTSLAYRDRLAAAKPGTEIAGTHWSAAAVAAWQATHRRLSPAEREELLGTWMLRSTDGGIHWSAAYRVPVNSPHGPVPVSDGRLLYAGKRLWHARKRIGVAESVDDGVSWRWLAEIPTRQGDDYTDYHELHLVEAADGRLVAHIRNHNEANHRETLQAESTDGGRTWSLPHPIGVWGLPSHLLRLRDGRLLMSYGYRWPPFGNQARISEDHGESWSGPLTISDDGAGTDLGYPSTIELDDGALVTVWYEKPADSKRAVLRQAVWELEG